MLNQIEQESLKLRQEHADVADSVEKTTAKYRDRMKNPRRINDIASRIIASPLLDGVVGTDAIFKVGIGPVVVHRAEKAIKNYDSNVDAIKEHYEENADAYHQMALDEAAAQNIPVSFRDDEAVNVNVQVEPNPLTAEITEARK